MKKLSMVFAIGLALTTAACDNAGSGPMGPSVQAPNYDYSLAWPATTTTTAVTTVTLGDTVTTTTTTSPTTTTTTVSVGKKGFKTSSDYGLIWP